MKLTDDELIQILQVGGLLIAEPFHVTKSYRKDRDIFTLCKTCGTKAHYRLKYILHKNEIGERICRACYWRNWYSEYHELYQESIRQIIQKGMSRAQLIEQGAITKKVDAK